MFHREYLDTVFQLAKNESLEQAISDAKLCYANLSLQKGWTLIPEYIRAINEFGELGINNKSFIHALFDIEYSNQYTQDFKILSIKKNKELYNLALKYAKSGFEGQELLDLITTCEFINGKPQYNQEVTDALPALWKRGANKSCSWLNDSLWYRQNNPTKNIRFNLENLKFINEMLDTGITPDNLNRIVYRSISYDNYAKKFAPESILESSNFSKSQIRGLVKYYNQTGVMSSIEDSFLDYNVPPEVLNQIDNIAKGVIEYIKPFAYVNEIKLTQAIEYTKRNIKPTIIKHLTQDTNLYNLLEKQTDLSFIKTENDAILVSKFWGIKDVKSINELSKEQRLNLIVDLMRNKVFFENNNISEKISLLPKTSEEYSKLMKDLSNSLGLNKPVFSQSHSTQIQECATQLVEK